MSKTEETTTIEATQLKLNAPHRSFVTTAFFSQMITTPTSLDYYDDYQASIVCAEKTFVSPGENETLIVHGDGKATGYHLKLQVKKRIFQIQKRQFPNSNKKEHEEHIKAILELLKKEKLYAKFSKCEFRFQGFKDPDHPDKVYKVVKALYGSHQAPRAWYETLANYLLGNRFKRGKIDQTLLSRSINGDILLVHVLSKILKKFNHTDVKYASTLVDLEKPLFKARDVDDVDVDIMATVVATSTTEAEYVLLLSAMETSNADSKLITGLWNPNQASLHQMANLDFFDTHNMIAFMNKSEGSEGFQQIVDFLNTSHIKFALTENPTIYTLLIQQFWQTASTSTLKDGEVEITTTIDGQLKTITEASLRRYLKLEDADGISSLPNIEFFEQLALMGYAFAFDKLTFQKGYFSP
ncbi:putative ribonuclease H-like domain-containing protein [Tanacetum coccineum]